MTYQVLARKWRPQDFESLVGQEPIVQALRNALLESRIAQAYLFSGIRGVGKTTAARVFAKALNCEREPGSKKKGEERPGADPCNECNACRQITEGNDMDVLEIDAATYSKVEQVRELTESLRYGAAKDRYKVVVLDEVHRLSRQAFDALLKIVEEPPKFLVFIFATTEIDAVPATILSRCQEFQFRRVPSPILAEHLRRIADAEKIEVSDPALRMIARSGEGSVRDAVALLDQLATFGGSAISDEEANHLLGGLDADLFRRLLAGILTGEHEVVTGLVREIEENGWDPQHVYGQFLVYVRDALHLALGGNVESIDLPIEESKSLAELVSEVSYEALLQLSQLLLTGEPTVRRSEYGLLAVEITWLRAAELPKITRLEDLLSGRVPADLPPEIARAAQRATAPAPKPKPPVEEPPPEPRIEEPPHIGEPEEPPPVEHAAEDAAEDIPEGTAEAPSFGAGHIGRLRDRLAEKPALAGYFNHDDGPRLSFDGTTLVIESGDPLLANALARKTNQTFLTDALTTICGQGANYEIRRGGGSRTPPKDTQKKAAAEVPANEPSSKTKPTKPRKTLTAKPPRTAPPSPPSEDTSSATDHPAVQAVLELFPGAIQGIEEKNQENDE